MAEPAAQFDSESLVARIIEELRTHPEAQALLLRALLTDEFLGMPVRMERMEADIGSLKAITSRMEADIGSLKATTNSLKAITSRMEADIAVLKGDSLEVKLHRRVRPLLSQQLSLRRTRILHSPLMETSPELYGPVEQAFANGVISSPQESRIDATDIIMRAARKADGSAVWVAVEVSNNISQNDIDRVRTSADALGAVFRQDAVAVAAGYHIHPKDQERADDVNVHVLLVSENG